MTKYQRSLETFARRYARAGVLVFALLPSIDALSKEKDSMYSLSTKLQDIASADVVFVTDDMQFRRRLDLENLRQVGCHYEVTDPGQLESLLTFLGTIQVTESPTALPVESRYALTMKRRNGDEVTLVADRQFQNVETTNARVDGVGALIAPGLSVTLPSWIRNTHLPQLNPYCRAAH